MAVEWFYFALLSSVLISGVNIIDKILISDYKIPPLVYVLVISATSLMPLVTLVFFHITPLPLGILAFAILVGFVRIYYTLPYFKALMVEEVSRVIPLLQLTPVFVLILSSLVLHEALRPPVSYTHLEPTRLLSISYAVFCLTKKTRPRILD